MHFLFDENISRSKTFMKLHPEFVNVSDEMRGAIDDKVLESAKKKDKVLVTRDKRLVLRALLIGVRVWYFDSENQAHPMQANAFEIEAKF